MEMLGIQQTQTNQKSAFNLRHLKTPLYLGLCAVSSGLFLLLEATTFSEYCESFYVMVSYLTFFIFVLELKRKSTNIFEMIMNFERIIQARKHHKKKIKFILDMIEITNNLFHF